jgi:hypothetical protein
MRAEDSAITSLSDGIERLRLALPPDRPGAAALWPALSRLDWAVALPSQAAPGFVYLAGSCRGSAVGGGGRDVAEAAGRLAGETSEVLALHEATAPCDLPPDPAIAALWGAGPLVEAVNLTRGVAVGVPRAAIDPYADPPPGRPPLSLGLAAAPDRAGARLAGVLELIERDAAAAWWAGETEPRALDAAESAPVLADLVRLRAGASGQRRATSVFRLPSRTGVPVACALSRDCEGAGLVFGLKAALDGRAAAAGAVAELLQMEIGLELSRLRAAQGRATAADAGPLALAALDPDGFAAFRTRPPGGAPDASVAGLDDLVAHLARLDLEVTVIDLAGPRGGLRVAKAFVPGLRPLPGPGLRPLAGAPGAAAALM